MIRRCSVLTTAFRLHPAAGSAPAQAVPVAESAAPPVAPVQPAADGNRSAAPSAAEQDTKPAETSVKPPMDNKKKWMIGAAAAAVLLIGYLIFFSGGNAQTPTPSLPSAQPAGDQTPGTQGGTDGYPPFGTTTPLDANYSLFTSNRFGFTCYVPINDYVTEDEEYNIYVSTDVQAGIPYTMVSRYDYTDAPGVLEAVMNNLQQAYGNAGYTVGAQMQTGSVTDYNTNASRTVYYPCATTMCRATPSLTGGTLSMSVSMSMSLPPRTSTRRRPKHSPLPI